MACSDNVVRAGLTPKPRDVETLCSMFTYSCEPASAKCFQGIQEDEYTLRFSPPIPDFSVAKICVSMKHVHYQCVMPLYVLHSSDKPESVFTLRQRQQDVPSFCQILKNV